MQMETIEHEKEVITTNVKAQEIHVVQQQTELKQEFKKLIVQVKGVCNECELGLTKIKADEAKL